jgi:uncharacterized protein (TIGR03435 family)
VVDRTGLSGRFDFNLKFNIASRIRGSVVGPPPIGAGVPAASDNVGAAGDNLFKALETQLGLKLEKSKAKLSALVIQHVEKVPTEN